MLRPLKSRVACIGPRLDLWLLSRQKQAVALMNEHDLFLIPAIKSGTLNIVEGWYEYRYE